MPIRGSMDPTMQQSKPRRQSRRHCLTESRCCTVTSRAARRLPTTSAHTPCWLTPATRPRRSSRASASCKAPPQAGRQGLPDFDLARLHLGGMGDARLLEPAPKNGSTARSGHAPPRSLSSTAPPPIPRCPLCGCAGTSERLPIDAASPYLLWQAELAITNAGAPPDEQAALWSRAASRLARSAPSARRRTRRQCGK